MCERARLDCSRFAEYVFTFSGVIKMKEEYKKVSEMLAQIINDHDGGKGISYRRLQAKLKHAGCRVPHSTIWEWVHGEQPLAEQDIEALSIALKLDAIKKASLLQAANYIHNNGYNKVTPAQIKKFQAELRRKNHLNNLKKTAEAILGDKLKSIDIREKPKNYKANMSTNEKNEANLVVITDPVSGLTEAEATLPYDVTIAEADYLLGNGKYLEGVSKQWLRSVIDENIRMVSMKNKPLVDCLITHLLVDYHFGDEESNPLLLLEKLKAFLDLDIDSFQGHCNGCP